MSEILKIAYRGDLFYGFERQKKHPSIQGRLEEVLSLLFKTPIHVHGAGRTDKGVHAKGQVVSFEAPFPIHNRQQILEAANKFLEPGIHILKWVARENFDARHSSMGKVYSYKFSFADFDPMRLDTYFYPHYFLFDEKQFCSALDLFVGEHNFRQFTDKREDKDNFVRSLEKILIQKENGEYEVIFRGLHFMTHMVRYLVGSGFLAARHKVELEDLRKALFGEKLLKREMAPARGLTLLEVKYDEDLFS